MMASSVTLSSLCHAIDLYMQLDKPSPSLSSFSWRSVPWLWDKLSIIEKASAAIGLFRFNSLRARILLPHLIFACLPYIERYESGVWRKQDEERLHQVIEFVVEQIQHESSSRKCKHIIPEELFLKITQASFFRSFSAEKEKIFHRLSLSQMKDDEKMKCKFSWGRYETFIQYATRLNNLISEIASLQKESGESQRSSISSASIDSSEKKEEIDQNISSFQTACLHKLQHIEKQVQKSLLHTHRLQDSIHKELKNLAIRLRFEPISLLEDVQLLEEKNFNHLLKIEQFLEEVLERINRRYTSFAILETLSSEIVLLEKEILAILSVEQAFLQNYRELQGMGNLILEEIDRKIHSFFKMLDLQPLLPSSSSLRSQQLKMMKMGRERLKQYKYYLYHVSGPTISYLELEESFLSLYKMITEFYNEGLEIEKSRKQVKAYIHNMASVEEADEKKSRCWINIDLEEAIKKAIRIEKDLETFVDRQELLQEIQDRLLKNSKDV